MFLILGAIRKLNPGLLALRKGLFKTGVDFGHDPKGKTLGILGMGRIGRAVEQRALPFGMNIIYHNRTVLSEDLAAGIPWVGFQQLLEESDVISIHLPLNQSTRHLIGAAEIASMKKGVVIVNTARGVILDEAALAEALERGHVGSVGLDVYEEEPVVHLLLIGNDRAVLLPHLGTHTTETLAAMEALAMENARRAICGEKLLTIVPEHLHI
jgi:glyoxylate reductase